MLINTVPVVFKFGLFGPRAKYCTAVCATARDWEADQPVDGWGWHVSFTSN